MEFACSPCVRAGFASTNCNKKKKSTVFWFLGFNLGALTPKLPLESHSRAWISWKSFPTVSSPKKTPLQTFYVDASASSSPAPVPNSMLTFTFFSQISATRQRGTEISRMDLENLKDYYSPDPRTSNPTLHICYTECILFYFLWHYFSNPCIKIRCLVSRFLTCPVIWKHQGANKIMNIYRGWLKYL